MRNDPASAESLFLFWSEIRLYLFPILGRKSMRKIILPFIIAGVLIAAIEISYRLTYGTPVITPGWTMMEFEWSIQNSKAKNIAFVVGDSRVGWGFFPSYFNEQAKKLSSNIEALPYIRSVNAGLPSASISGIVSEIVKTKDPSFGILVINFSPAGMYHFEMDPFSQETISLQDYLDERISNAIRNYLFTCGVGWQACMNHFISYAKNGVKPRSAWIRRNVYWGGIVNANLICVGKPDFDISQFQLEYYGKILAKISNNHEKSEQNKILFEKEVRRAVDKGWKVIMIRMPVGSQMQEIEKTLPEHLSPEKICSELDIPYIDYNNSDLAGQMKTIDQSHLDPESARIISGRIADDLYHLLQN
jgi:hypothetical protein